jgi:hypothetical protein
MADIPIIGEGEDQVKRRILTYKGKPLADMTKEELITICETLATRINTIAHENIRHMETVHAIIKGG